MGCRPGTFTGCAFAPALPLGKHGLTSRHVEHYLALPCANLPATTCRYSSDLPTGRSWRFSHIPLRVPAFLPSQPYYLFHYHHRTPEPPDYCRTPCGRHRLDAVPAVVYLTGMPPHTCLCTFTFGFLRGSPLPAAAARYFAFGDATYDVPKTHTHTRGLLLHAALLLRSVAVLLIVLV